MDNTIGDNIRKLRAEKNLTQKELAAKSFISLSALNKYERGDRVPKIDALEKISEALNVQVDYLLGRSVFKKFDSQIMKDDIFHLIEKTDNSDKIFAKLIRNIVDTMFLSINSLADDKHIESLTIIHDLYRKIWEIKILQEDNVAFDLLNANSNNSDETFEECKKVIISLLDKWYKNI